MESSVAELLEEANAVVENIEANLPKRSDPASISMIAKVPWKAVECREPLLWRSAELARAAITHYKSGELTVATVLTRALMECAAATFAIARKIRVSIDQKDSGSSDEFFMRMLLGSRNGDTGPKAINVLDCLDKADKVYNGFRDQYDGLSEIAHPNWRGTAALYGKIDKKNIWTDFGNNPHGNEDYKLIGLLALTCGLSILEHHYNEISDLMPAFVALCEAEIEAENARKTVT